MAGYVYPYYTSSYYAGGPSPSVYPQWNGYYGYGYRRKVPPMMPQQQGDWFGPAPGRAPAPKDELSALEAMIAGSLASSIRSQSGPSQVRAKHILVKTRQEAEKYRRQIMAGKRFEEIARKVSQCPSKAKGGDLGFFSRGEMVPEFDKVAFSLPVGAVSQPVQTDFGWHLIKVEAQK